MSIARLPIVLAILYLCLAGPSAWQVVRHTNASTNCLDQSFERNSIGNQGAQVAASFSKEHGIIGSLLTGYLQKKSALPTLQASSKALAEIPLLVERQAQEEAQASWWSWAFIGLSLLYLAVAALCGGAERMRAVLLALTAVSALAFAVGVMASALMIFTTIHDLFGKSPVILHQVRSVYGVIASLFSSGHWVFGGFIALFSIATPVAKIALTLAAALTPSRALNAKVTRLLNAIGKWSMTDVFVGAVLLACFTIKSSGGTQAIPFRGLYYFAAYCLLSMVTTSLLARLNFGKFDAFFDPEGQLRIPAIGELVGVGLFLAAVHSLKGP